MNDMRSDEIYKRKSDHRNNLQKNSTTTKNRKEALKDGDKVYRGKECPHGHNGIRYTRSCSCVACDINSKVIKKFGGDRASNLSATKARRKAEQIIEDKKLRDELDY